MPALRHIDSLKQYSQRISSILEITAYILCFVTLVTALVNDSLSMKLFSISAAVSFIAIILRGKPENFNIKYWLLPLSLLLIGVLDLIWYSLFKESHSPFRSTYHSYLNTAKVMILSSSLILLVLNSRLRPNTEIFLYILYSLSFIIAGYAHYIKITTGLSRIDFGIGTATGAAYSIMFVGIISAVSILYSKKNHPVLFILNVITVFYALALTQTRSTMLIFPVICIITLTSCYLKHPKKLFYSVIGFLILLITLLFVFNKPILDRYNESISDLHQYNNNNSVNSIGARLAMFEIGYDIFSQAPFSLRSADERAQMMNDIAKHKSYLTGSLEFTNVHLHNELVEAASLKGIAGILSILLFYVALFYTVYHHRSLGLFALTLAIIGVGLSDVLIWSRSIPIILACTITLLLFIKKHK